MAIRLSYILFPLLAFMIPGCCFSAVPDCYSRLNSDTLTVGNSLVERKFVWNGGNLMTASITDKVSGKVLRSVRFEPDFVMTSAPDRAATARILRKMYPRLR